MDSAKSFGASGKVAARRDETRSLGKREKKSGVVIVGSERSLVVGSEKREDREFGWTLGLEGGKKRGGKTSGIVGGGAVIALWGVHDMAWHVACCMLHVACRMLHITYCIASAASLSMPVGGKEMGLTREDLRVGLL